MHEILVLVLTFRISVFSRCKVVKNVDCEINLHFFKHMIELFVKISNYTVKSAILDQENGKKVLEIRKLSLNLTCPIGNYLKWPKTLNSSFLSSFLIRDYELSRLTAVVWRKTVENKLKRHISESFTEQIYVSIPLKKSKTENTSATSASQHCLKPHCGTFSL